MAAYNVELRKNDGSAFADLFYPKTTWAMVDGKPSTFTPTTHNHSASDINSGTLSADRIPSTLNDTYARRLFVNANGVPTNNLGSPTIAEMALFQEQFNNKTEFYDITKITFESYDGSSWTDVTSSITEQQRKRFIGGDITATVNIPNLAVKYRITLRATSYVCLNALYIYWSSQSHSTKVTIWKKHDSGSWEQVTSSSASVSSWPGHLYLPFPTIPWNPTATLGAHWHEVRIEFEPTWSKHPTYGGYPIALYRMQLWGGYPAGRRTIYSLDENKNASFPADVFAAGQVLVKTNDSRLSDSRPASDVYAWAKAASKPAYTYSEVGAEQAFSKNTAFNKNFGTAAGTVCQGNDSRLSDARTPVSHATDDDSYGLGDSDYYGHCLIINHLLRSVQQDGEALSAYQGYILKGLVDGKAADDHTQAVTKGGTGLTSISIGEMLYASGANVIAKVPSSSFGRGLLNASTGVMVSGLNANTLAGYGHSDFRKTSEAVFRSIKDWTTYVSTNGSTAVALPTTESVSDRLIGVVLNTSTSSTYQRTVVWIKISSTSGTTYQAAFNLGSVGQDSSTSSIYIYEAEFYQSSGVLYIDDATRTSLTPGSPVNGSKVSTSSDINIWDIYVLD